MIALVCLFLLIVRRSPINAFAFGGLAASGWLASQFFKVIVERQRPNPALLFDPLAPETGSNSFPSGHVALAVGLAWAFWFLLRKGPWAKLSVVLAVLVPVVVALSRLYVGVHYPTDVVASFLAASAGVFLFAGVWNRYQGALMPRIPLLDRLGPVTAQPAVTGSTLMKDPSATSPPETLIEVLVLQQFMIPTVQGLLPSGALSTGTLSTGAVPSGLLSFLDPAALLSGLGPATLAVVALMVFIESGLLFPFLPGDSLLFTAGLLHQQLNLSLPVLIGVVVLAAVTGDQVGYMLGRKFGRRWFKDDARILKTKYLVETEEFFAKRGGWAIVLARFVPIVRTYAPLVAGVANYNHKKFTLWNIAGAVGWAGSIVLLGTWLGHYEIVANNIDVIAVVLVLVSILPGAISILHKRKVTRSAVEVSAESSSALSPQTSAQAQAHLKTQSAAQAPPHLRWHGESHRGRSNRGQ
ncbi:phosphatase PAP2 family protein [Arthrobacter polaris]|uniref:phosphatase PAP2 family protein n=1 Tax=Arthrobacter polaris TaxID=2813727 RepID=UPI003D7D2E4D